MAFPVIYRHGTQVQQPVVTSLVDQMAHDPAIRSAADGGYVTSRARFTRIPRRWGVRYRWVQNDSSISPAVTNKDTIQAWEDTVYGGSDSFTWVKPENPISATTYTVRLMGPIVYTPEPDAGLKWWMIEFELEEV